MYNSIYYYSKEKSTVNVSLRGSKCSVGTESGLGNLVSYGTFFPVPSHVSPLLKTTCIYLRAPDP